MNANHDFICQTVDFLFHDTNGLIGSKDVKGRIAFLFKSPLTKEEKKVIETRLKDLQFSELTYYFVGLCILNIECI